MAKTSRNGPSLKATAGFAETSDVRDVLADLRASAGPRKQELIDKVPTSLVSILLC